jgi:hypothetical protein
VTARWLSLLVVLVFSARSAYADDRAEAGKAFSAGQALDKKKQYAKAIDQYVIAFKLVQHENTAYNIALDYERLGKLRDAYEWYGTFVDMTGDQKERERVEGKMEQLRAKPSPIVITSKPSGAQVIIDGNKVGTTPYRGEVNEGSRTIVVKIDDTKRDERRHLAEFGERIVIEVSWEAPSATTPQSGSTPQSGPSAQNGLVVPEYGTAGDPRSVGPGATAARTPNQVILTGETPTPPRVVKWLAGGGAGAGFGESIHEYVFGTVGVQLGQSDIVLRAGDARRNLGLEGGIRWRFINAGKFAMYAGFLVNYIGSVGGLGLPVGFRLDVSESEKRTWAVTIETGARFYYASFDSDSDEAVTNRVFPVLAFLEMRQ